VSLEFLSPDVAAPGAGRTPVARSPMERAARRAGAQLEVRDGWSVAASFGDLAEERAACSGRAGWTDTSHLGKLELQGGDVPPLELGTASRIDGAWWCPVNPSRVLVLCEPGETAAVRARLELTGGDVVDLSAAYAAITISGPLAREVFARFCALDLRPDVTPVGAFRPGSVARTPGFVLREAPERYLALVGAALGEYLWTVVEDAGRHLGGRPAGLDALAAAPEEEPAHA
jgi:heterotetrameric sarcosine oxidase gamma subunit